MKILVAEPLAAAGIELLKAQPGWDIVISNPKEYAQHLADADALLVRSAVKVNADVFGEGAQAESHRARGRGRGQRRSSGCHRRGRAGDEYAGRQRRLGRRAHSGTHAGHGTFDSAGQRLHQVRQMGKEEVHGQSELRGKTLGIVGLGSIGREVVRRARGFEMKIVANDPYAN